MNKKTLLAGIAACLLLSGCAGYSSSTDPPTSEGTTSQQTQAPPSPSDSIASDAAQTKLLYYEELVKSLKDELLSVRTEWYMERSELQAQIEALKAGGGSSSGTTTPPVSDGTGTTAPQQSVASVFTYTIGEGGVTILSYTGKGTKVEVPSEIEGQKVCAIADRAFENRTSLTSVTLPEGIEKIGWFSFSGCVSLESVTLPKTLTSVAYGAFENCSSKLTVHCEKGSYAEAYARSYGMRVQS